MHAVARSATAHAGPEAMSTMMASNELWAFVPSVTPAHAHAPEQPNPLTAMRSLFGEAWMPAVMAAEVHGGPTAAALVEVVVGGTVVVVVVVVVVDLARAAGELLQPASARATTMPSAVAPGRAR